MFEERYSSKWFWLLPLIVILTWFFYPLVLDIYREELSTSDSNHELGDSFGVLNALFSGLAFTGIIVSIFMQSIELRLIRKEHKALTDEAITQNIQFEKQSSVINKQLFEGTFFQMLTLHRDILDAIKTKDNRTESQSKIIYSRDAVNEICHLANLSVSSKPKQLSLLTFRPDKKDMIERFNNAVDCKIGIEVYFRNVFQILKYIDENEVNKKKYAEIYKSQFVNCELELIFYHCLKEDKGEFKNLLERYSFFSFLNVHPSSISEVKKLYNITAFTGNNLFGH